MDPRRTLRAGLTLRVAFDTNILVYAEGVRQDGDDAPKAAICRDLLDMAGEGRSTGFVAAQVLAEAHHVFTRKLGLTREQAVLRLRDLVLGIDVLPTTAALLADAFDLAARHRLQTFDAIILAAAAEARCDVFYSEDMQHGFGWRGVAVVDPFR